MFGSSHLHLSLQSLTTDSVHGTEPMKRRQSTDRRDQPPDTSLVDRTPRFELDVPYEQLMARSTSARSGRAVDHADAMAKVRSTIKDATT
jgi:hypothetical protein